MTARATAYVSLLRGINVGPSSQVSMPRLQEIYTSVGLRSVQTYIRSGNVVFASEERPDAVRARIEGAIAAELGVSIDVVVRTRDELGDVIRRCPYAEADPRHVAVAFLAAPVPDVLRHDLSALDLGDDAWHADGREIFLHLPHGFGRSRLAARMHALRAPVVGTVRNWRTVATLAEMLRECPVGH